MLAPAKPELYPECDLHWLRFVAKNIVFLRSTPKPSTRSAGFSSWSVAEGSASGGFLARSESGVAPGYDGGGWGALRSLGIGLRVI
jgi:hypothetical protein